MKGCPQWVIGRLSFLPWTLSPGEASWGRWSALNTSQRGTWAQSTMTGTVGAKGLPVGSEGCAIPGKTGRLWLFPVDWKSRPQLSQMPRESNKGKMSRIAEVPSGPPNRQGALTLLTPRTVQGPCHVGSQLWKIGVWGSFWVVPVPIRHTGWPVSTGSPPSQSGEWPWASCWCLLVLGLCPGSRDEAPRPSVPGGRQPWLHSRIHRELYKGPVPKPRPCVWG